MNELLNISEAAKLAGVRPPAVRWWVDHGMVRAKPILYGRTRVRHLIPRCDVEDQMARLRVSKSQGGRRKKPNVPGSGPTAQAALPAYLQADLADSTVTPMAKAAALLCWSLGEPRATAAALTASMVERIAAELGPELMAATPRQAPGLAKVAADLMAMDWKPGTVAAAVYGAASVGLAYERLGVELAALQAMELAIRDTKTKAGSFVSNEGSVE